MPVSVADKVEFLIAQRFTFQNHSSNTTFLSTIQEYMESLNKNMQQHNFFFIACNDTTNLTHGTTKQSKGKQIDQFQTPNIDTKHIE
jgi:hypothetical protein